VSLFRRFLRRSMRPPESDASIGSAGEDTAVRHLRSDGYRIRTRNWRCSLGEIDIVAEQDGVLVIVEVKTSLKRGSIPPELRVNPAKQSRLRRLAAAYAKSERVALGIRFDVIAVWWTDDGFQIEHLTNAFS
jgi:putative endonuclease